jgi:hypothetical protein
MGAMFSTPPYDEQRDYINALPKGNRNEELVSIKLTCTDFDTFNGRCNQWITFKENTLSKAGVGGYAQFFRTDYTPSEHIREGNQRIFYLLQNATNGGGASHIIHRHMQEADGHAAWQSLLAWYESQLCPGRYQKHFEQNYGPYADNQKAMLTGIKMILPSTWISSGS